MTTLAKTPQIQDTSTSLNTSQANSIVAKNGKKEITVDTVYIPPLYNDKATPSSDWNDLVVDDPKVDTVALQTCLQKLSALCSENRSATENESTTDQSGETTETKTSFETTDGVVGAPKAQGGPVVTAEDTSIGKKFESGIDSAMQQVDQGNYMAALSTLMMLFLDLFAIEKKGNLDSLLQSLDRSAEKLEKMLKKIEDQINAQKGATDTQNGIAICAAFVQVFLQAIFLLRGSKLAVKQNKLMKESEQLGKSTDQLSSKLEKGEQVTKDLQKFVDQDLSRANTNTSAATQRQQMSEEVKTVADDLSTARKATTGIKNEAEKSISEELRDIEHTMKSNNHLISMCGVLNAIGQSAGALAAAPLTKDAQTYGKEKERIETEQQWETQYRSLDSSRSESWSQLFSAVLNNTQQVFSNQAESQKFAARNTA
ncbi:hypothetical protein [Noviherbaspirillum pedocola]|uniref:Uncharacterized protein n=1 Tax=Noviherbaspirillum pedocola TaxID=2801341 RepID=A0A934SMD2_9BURK|nr:hypothetical protein [Noviherbaspirillum pedocola]MBK4733231.1 hypothetical protein [Noviherbaspirillum pedocola]